jgi:hypothetical protein
MYALRKRDACPRPPRLSNTRWYRLQLGAGGPKSLEGFGAKGHVLLIRVTRGPECPLHCFYALNQISPQAFSPPHKPLPYLGITSTAAQF